MRTIRKESTQRALGVTLAVATLAALMPPSGDADVVIPSSAFSTGANFAEFHSDVRIFNPTESAVNVVPIFFDAATGAVVEKPAITIGARQQVAYDNVLQSLFGQGLGHFGPIRFQTSAPILVSSSVNNVNALNAGLVAGQWLPGVDTSKAVTAGTLLHLASSTDGATGYRTNVAFVNVGTGGNATISAKVRKGDGTLLSTVTLPAIGPNGFFQRKLDDATFPGMGALTDTNLWLEFTSDRPVLAFASVINNASGDPFAIVTTAEPEAATPTPTPTPTPTATIPPVVPSVTPTATPTTPQSGPVEISILAKQWTYEPKTVTLKVGTTYKVTFTTDDVRHGVGGLALLGIVNCNLIAPGIPCTTTITPSGNQVGTYTYFCTQNDCGAGHNSMEATMVVSK